MAGQDTLTFTDGTFEADVLRSDEPVLVDFWAPWCGPCRVVAPTIDKVATAWKGRVRVGKLNIDDNEATAQAFGIQSIPSLVLFVGGRAVDGLVGAASESHLERMVARYLEPAA